MIFPEDAPPAAAPFPLIRNSGRNLVSRVSRVARTLRRAADSASEAMQQSGQAETDRPARAEEAAGRAHAVVVKAGELLARLERAAELVSKKPATIKTAGNASSLRSRAADDVRAIVDEADKAIDCVAHAHQPATHATDPAAALRDLIAPRLGVLRIRTGNAINTISRDAQAAHHSVKELLSECDALARGAQAALTTARASCEATTSSLGPVIDSSEFAEAERLAADVLTRHTAALDVVSSALRAARRLEHSHARLTTALAAADEAAITTPAAALRAIAARDAAPR